MLENNKSFFSKVLLAGEYTVMTNGIALAIPFPVFSGRFEIRKGATQSALFRLYDYLKENDMQEYINLDEMDAALKNGLYYHSDIPIGYGLGSSGALTAALYERFGKNKSNDPQQLKAILGKIESAFHGTSSGMDPFVSYTGKPVLFTRDGIQIIKEHELNLQHFFLIDSGISRSTAHYVDIFKQKLHSSADYTDQIKSLERINQSLIQAVFSADSEALKNCMKAISTLQYDLFQEMIPYDFKSLWSAGLQSDTYCFKLCGAGGGGMLLGWSEQKVLPFEYPVYWIR